MNRQITSPGEEPAAQAISYNSTSCLAFLGPNGSHSEFAAKQWSNRNNQLTKQYEFSEQDSFASIIKTVDSNPGYYGIIPIENSIGGDVAGAFEQLYSVKFNIVGEIYLKIKHHLAIAQPREEAQLNLEIMLNRIQTLHAHPQASLQCSTFLEHYKEWSNVVSSSTSQSAQEVELAARKGDYSHACICSKEAAKLHNLTIINENIGNYSENYTRFLVITKARNEQKLRSFADHAQFSNPKPNQNQNANQSNLKYTIIFEAAHEPGSLLKILETIANQGANMTKIESRAIPSKPWNYQFYIDFTSITQVDLQSIAANTINMSLLGIYKQGNYASE